MTKHSLHSDSLLLFFNLVEKLVKNSMRLITFIIFSIVDLVNNGSLGLIFRNSIYVCVCVCIYNFPITDAFTESSPVTTLRIRVGRTKSLDRQ